MSPQIAQMPQIQSKTLYIKTHGAQTALSALDRCVRDEILSVIIGAPGVGKNKTIRYWSKQNRGKVRHLIVEATVRNAPRPLLAAISKALGIEGMEHRTLDKVCVALAERLAKDPVAVIINEADMLSMVAFEKLRGIWDMVSELRDADGERAFPLALFGTPRLREMLQRPDLERLHRRVGEFDVMLPMNQAELQTAVKAKWPEAKVEAAAFDELTRLSRGSFGWLDKIMPKAIELAAKDGNAINSRILEVTRRYLLGLPEMNA